MNNSRRVKLAFQTNKYSLTKRVLTEVEGMLQEEEVEE